MNTQISVIRLRGGVTAGLWLLAAALFYLLRWPEYLGLNWDISLPIAQLAALPLVLAAIWSTSLFGIRMPRRLFVGAICIIVVALSYSYLAPGRIFGEFVLARLWGDEREAESIRFAERLSLHRGAFASIDLTRHFDAFYSHADVVKRFGSSRHAKVVIWGNSTWINLSWPKSGTSTHSLALTAKDPSLVDLEMVDSIGAIGLSYSPQAETAQYISEILSAEAREAGFGQQETALRAAGSIDARWTLLLHRSFAWWREGNLHLNMAIENTEFEPGELRCADEAYRIARGLLSAANHPDLFAAILNNQAIVSYLLGFLEGDAEKTRRARVGFRGAAKEVRGEDPFGLEPRANLAGRLNLNLLNSQKPISE